MPDRDRRMTPLVLRPPVPSDESAVRAAQGVLAAENFVFALFLRDLPFADWLGRLQRDAAGDVPADRVPSDFLIAEVDGQLVGRASIRHDLNDVLRAYGGHIGYCVLPPFRRQGYAREILHRSLAIARTRGVARVLLTCDDDNVASIATIEGAGGRRDAEWPLAEGDGAAKRRYWFG